MIDEDKVKKCYCCKQYKKFEAFHKCIGTKYGLQNTCKKCRWLNSKSKKNKISTIYKSQKQNSVRRKHEPPDYSKRELTVWCMQQTLFHVLHKEWEHSGYKKELAPSCDRIDDYKSYTLNNLQLTTWGENNKKANNDRKDGINNKGSKAVIQIKDTILIATYYSIRQASITTGINHGNIAACCRGVKPIAGSFSWKFK